MNARYLEYLKSPQWKAKRKAVKTRCAGICERCRIYLFDEVHHLTYANLYDEPLEDLIGLCKPCHRFQHGRSGIDPLEPVILVKITNCTLEYRQSVRKPARRIKLAQPKFQGIKFAVPTRIFLDADGNPILDPSRWTQYRTHSRIGDTWHSCVPTGRHREPDPAKEQAFEDGRKQRRAMEQERQAKRPDDFTSYAGNLPKTEKEIMALFRRHARIFTSGFEMVIKSVRTTKTRGIVLDVYHDSGGRLFWWKHYNAERDLASGKIVLDRKRGMWICKD
jgi:hypothetical protein